MKNLKHLLSEKALPYYVHQDTIESYHPVVSHHVNTHAIYEAAQILVSERFEKSELTELVAALLHLSDEVEFCSYGCPSPSELYDDCPRHGTKEKI